MNRIINILLKYWIFILPLPLMVGFLIYRKLRNRKMPKIKPNASLGLQKVAKKYGVAYAREIEKAMRIETAHFTSVQWLKTGTAGMEAKNNVFPFGWSSLSEFSKIKGLNENFFFLKKMKDNHDGREPYFIGFSDTGVFVEFFAWFIQTKRGGDVLSWYRLPNSQLAIQQRDKYRQTMDKIQTKFV